MSQDVVQQLQDFVRNLLNDPQAASEFSADPQGTLAEHGITNESLQGVDVGGSINQVCSSEMGSNYQQVGGYLQGGGEYHHGGYDAAPVHEGHPLDQAIHATQTVTYVTYQDNHQIVNNIVDNSHNTYVDNSYNDNSFNDNSYNDNSVNVDAGTHVDNSVNVGGDAHGDITVDNATATGDHAIASDGPTSVAQGDGAVSQQGYGNQAVTGDHNVQAGGGIGGNAVAGDNHGIVNQGGEVDGTAIGDGNHVDGHQTTQVQHIGGDVTDSSVGGFGSGSTTNAGHNTDNSYTDNSYNDNSYSDSSDNSVHDSSRHTDNSVHDSSQHQYTDNSYNDNSYDDSSQHLDHSNVEHGSGGLYDNNSLTADSGHEPAHDYSAPAEPEIHHGS